MKGTILPLLLAITLSVSILSNAEAITVSSVNIPGSFQNEIGCPGDWQPECAVSYLMDDLNSDVWQNAFAIPAGSWEYKAAINGTWDVNYGAGGVQDGPNISLNLSEATNVKFYFDENTHWITDNVNSIIATVPGSFQSELGCSGDWDPTCLGSWLQDADGDGIFSFSALLPLGDYEAKVAIGESWDENYGVGGILNGPNIPFSVSSLSDVFFSYNSSTHILEITQADPAPIPEPSTFLLLGGGLAGLAFYARRRRKE